LSRTALLLVDIDIYLELTRFGGSDLGSDFLLVFSRHLVMMWMHDGRIPSTRRLKFKIENKKTARKAKSAIHFIHGVL
jgi:hypothetical protein